MNIIETNLKFGRLRNRRSTTKIIIHHTASLDNRVSVFHSQHLTSGWSGVGYHFLIRTNGVVERGRPEHVIGSHAPRVNNISLGIALTGNFERIAPSVRQISSLLNLVAFLKQKYPITDILLHSDVSATKCPGRFFPREILEQM